MRGDPDRKRRRVRLLQRWLLNPPVKVLTWAGLAPGCALLETTGRRSGRHRRTVVGVHVDDATVWVVAEHGGHAGYVRNLTADPRVRIRIARRWRAGRARVVPGDDPQARLRSFGRPLHAAAVRRFSTEPVTVRLDLDAPGGAPSGGASGA